jgi:WD40 repeat protein
MPILVQDGENAKPLLTALGSTDDHCYLIGEGGIGKTTALLHIMNDTYTHAYRQDRPVPIFVELSFAPDTYGALYEGGKSSFIRRAIFKQLRTDRSIKQISARDVRDIDEVFTAVPYEVAVQPITEALSRENPKPDYLLLLDGLNEVSTVKPDPDCQLTVMQMVAQEIKMLATECPNVRIVLTSRADEALVNGEGITRLTLTGIEAPAIRAYLEEAGMEADQLERILENADLCKVLRVPLFLTMFATLSQSEGITTQGEILRTFLGERRKNVGVYTLPQRLDTVADNVAHAASANQAKRIDGDMQIFILDHLLPEIARYMEKNDEFYLWVDEICDLIEPVLTDTGDTAVCGKFGRTAFGKFRSGSAGQHTFKVASALCSRLSPEGDMEEITEKIVDCCVFSLGILQENGGRYGFIHQHIRDYFAAVRYVNALVLANHLFDRKQKEMALACLDQVFQEESVSFAVRRFIGQQLGEHRNQPHFSDGGWHSSLPDMPCDRTLLSQTLHIYRGVTMRSDNYGLYTLLKILEEARGALAGLDLRALDLQKPEPRGCSLNGNGLGLPGLTARLEGARINKESLFAAGHRDVIRSVQFSRDGSRLLSAAADGTVKLWDVRTGSLLASLPHDRRVIAAAFMRDEKYVLTLVGDELWVSLENEFYLWDAQTETLVSRTEALAYAERFAVSPDGRYVIVISTYSAQVLSLPDFGLCCDILVEYRESGSDNIVDAAFIGDGTKLALLLQTERTKQTPCITRLELWDVPDGEKKKEMTVPGGGVAVEAAEDGRIAVFVQDQETNEAKKLLYAPWLQLLREGVCDVERPEHRGEKDSRLGIEQVRYCEDGHAYMLVFNREVRLYAANTDSLLHIYPSFRCTAAALDRNGALTAFGTYNGELLTCRVSDYAPVSVIRGAVSEVRSFAFSPDSRYIAMTGGQIELRDAGTGEVIGQQKMENRTTKDATRFSPAGDLLYPAGCADGLLSVPTLGTAVKCDEEIIFDLEGRYYGRVRNGVTRADSAIYDLRTHQLVCRLEGMLLVAFRGDTAIAMCDIRSMMFMKMPQGLAVVSLPDGGLLRKLETPGGRVNDPVVCGRYIAALFPGDQLCLWQDEQLQTVSMKNSYLHKLAFNATGDYLIEHYWDETWVRATRSPQEAVALEGAFVQATARYLLLLSKANGEKKRKLLVYELESLRLLWTQPVYTSETMQLPAACISPDEKKLLILEEESCLGLYRLTDSGPERIVQLRSAAGMELRGVDLRNVCLDKPLSDGEAKLLRQYGAIL